LPKNVLVVEDLPAAREMWRIFLTSEGYSVVNARDGQEGVRVARVEKPDIIITNLNMPRLDGMEMTKQLRRQPEFSKLPILILSTVTIDGLQILLNAGANLVKSELIELEELIDVIRDALAAVGDGN
jgi:two-component system chemotaxis response regulator CheY